MVDMLGKEPKTSVAKVQQELVKDGHDVSWSMVHGSSPHGSQLGVRQSRETASSHGSGEPCPMLSAHRWFWSFLHSDVTSA